MGRVLSTFHFPLSTFPLSTFHFPLSLSFSLSFSSRSTCPRRIFLPRRFFYHAFHDLTFRRLVVSGERNGGVLPRRRKTVVVKRPRAMLQRQKDVVRAIALCPNEEPLIFTSDASKWSVRKRTRREKRKQGWKEQTRQIAPRDEPTIRFSLSVP